MWVRLLKVFSYGLSNGMRAIRDERQYRSHGILACDACFDDCHFAQREGTCLVKHNDSRVLDTLSRNCCLFAHQHCTVPCIYSSRSQHTLNKTPSLAATAPVMTMTIGTHSTMAQGHVTTSTAIVYRRAAKPAWLKFSWRTRDPTIIQTTNTITATTRITGPRKPAARSAISWIGRRASCSCRRHECTDFSDCVLGRYPNNLHVDRRC